MSEDFPGPRQIKGEDRNKFIDLHTLDLHGKAYLPVAPRVVLFRDDHGLTLGIETEEKIIDGKLYIKATIKTLDGKILASAHKQEKVGGAGAAKFWPFETAETGAIGRALNLCGYGTLMGDLDEGDQLADAPVDMKENNNPKHPTPTKPNILVARPVDKSLLGKRPQ